jgi:predicted nucleotidyltransferase
MAASQDLLQTIVGILTANDVPYEVIDGIAAFAYVEDSEAADLAQFTKDVDILINRIDLDKTIWAAGEKGFTYRHAAGLDMLVPPGETRARNSVHLLFAGESAKDQLVPNPHLRPEIKSLDGHTVQMISAEDLIVMKLSAFRPKDVVHIQAFDAAGLITPEFEKKLSPQLAKRLKRVRRWPK